MTKKCFQGRSQIPRLEISSSAFFDQNLRYYEKTNKERVPLVTITTTAAATPTIIIKPE
jgi:hypothetical protein